MAPSPVHPWACFCLVLLGQWHGLSDAALEQALCVRLDFMVFIGFEPSSGEMTDASTICRFRNRLVTVGYGSGSPSSTASWSTRA